jgi:hypothetical protein
MQAVAGVGHLFLPAGEVSPDSGEDLGDDRIVFEEG